MPQSGSQLYCTVIIVISKMWITLLISRGESD